MEYFELLKRRNGEIDVLSTEVRSFSARLLEQEYRNVKQERAFSARFLEQEHRNVEQERAFSARLLEQGRENKILHTAINNLNNEIVSLQKSFKEEFEENNKQWRKSGSSQTASRTRLLAGSIASCFLQRLSHYVFSDLSEHTSIQSIRNAATPEQCQRLDVLFSEHKIQDEDVLEETLKYLKKNCYYDAHPTRITQEQENDLASDPPTQEQLNAVVQATFKANKVKHQRILAFSMVGALVSLAAREGVESLELTK